MNFTRLESLTYALLFWVLFLAIVGAWRRAIP